MADGKIPDRIWCNPEGHWHSFDDSESRYHPSVPCVRADLHDALAKERDELQVEVERLRRELNSIYENVEYWNTLQISSKIRAALQRKEGNE